MQDYPIEEIVDALRAGNLVALPTETVYGLAANALNPLAVKKIFEVKGRPYIDPLIVHAYNLAQVEQLAFLPDIAYKLAEKFWPGPLTLVLPKKSIVPDIVTAGLSSVAIRIPMHPIFREFLAASKLPLAAPSANPFGYLSPTEAKHVQKTLGSKVKYIIDGGPCPIGFESTILSLMDPNNPEILRPGPISAEDLEHIFGFKPKYAMASAGADEGAQMSPGLLKSHYSPRTLLKLFDSSNIPYHDEGLEKHAVIFVMRPKALDKCQETEFLKIFWLSENGDLNEVGKNLFSLLERIDDQGFECVFVERPENRGIGIAINDRLSRAAHKGSSVTKP